MVFGCLLGLGNNKWKICAIAIQVEMQCCPLYITCHAIRAANATTYWINHRIVDNDMV